MPQKISSYYNDEIKSWIHSIDFYLEEILSLENRLYQIITRNTIVDIAAKTEVHQMFINKSEEKFLILKKNLTNVLKQLSSNGKLIDDKLISKSLELKISTTGISFRKLEREYVDMKFSCNEFVEEMLRKGEGR